MHKKIFAVASMTALFAMSGCRSPENSAFDALVLNKPAPDFELQALGGGSVRLSKQRGKPIVLAFFAHG